MSSSAPIRSTTQIPQPVRQSTRLPTAFPNIPVEMFTGDAATRRTVAERWNDEARLWWKTARLAMEQDYEELSFGSNTSINKSNTVEDLLRTEITARNDGDAALLKQIQTLVLSTGPNRIFVQTEAPDSPQVGDLWFDSNDGFRRWLYDGTEWVDVTDAKIAGAITAISTEQTTRLAADNALAASITALVSRLDDTDSDVSGQATALDALTTEVSGLGNNITAAAARISTIEATIDTPETGLRAVVSNIANTYVTAIDAAATADSRITAQLQANGSIKSAIQTLEDRVYVGAGSLATKVGTLESQIQTPGTGLLAKVSAIESTYATDDEVAASSTAAITAAKTYADGEVSSLSAAISNTYATKVYANSTAESTALQKITAALGAGGSIKAAIDVEALARTTAEANLASWGLSLTAGNVVTGMKLSAASGAGGSVSEVAFQADRLKVFNGSTGEAPFEVSGGRTRVKCLVAGLVSTFSARFHPDAPDKTMPNVARVSADVGYVSSGAIPYYPGWYWATSDALIFKGWTQGAAGLVMNRFGNATQHFTIEAIGNGNGGNIYMVYGLGYRKSTDGGSTWGAWSGIGHDLYCASGGDGNVNAAGTLDVGGLTGNHAIQFGVRLAKPAGCYGMSLGGCYLSAHAFN